MNFSKKWVKRLVIFGIGVGVPLFLFVQLFVELIDFHTTTSTTTWTVQEELASIILAVSSSSSAGKAKAVLAAQKLRIEDDDLPVWRHNNPFFLNATRDIFCHGCRANPNYVNNRCGSRDVLFPKDGGGAAAAAAAPENLPAKCRYCLQCPERNRWYGRLDEAFPTHQQAVSHYLASIPHEYRLPHNISFWREYFNDPANAYPQHLYFNEYNPSIVRIPQHQIPPPFKDEGVVFLASFRVTTRQFCQVDQAMLLAMMGYPNATNGKWPKSLRRQQFKHKDLLGLALLRDDLSIVTDAVYNLQWHAKLKIEDSRLFALHDELYWSAGQTLHPLWLVPEHIDNNNNSSSSRANAPKGTSVPPKFSSNSWTSPLYIKKNGACTQKGNPGKNLQFFVDRSDGAVVTELFPMGKKTQIDANADCPKSIIGARPFNRTFPAGKRSFGTVDELHFWKHRVQLYSVLTSERGSYCCVQTEHDGQPLLLGISHSKFKFQGSKNRHSLPGNVSANHFFSTFYLMEAAPPYSVVAQSGKFCLGYPSEQEVATQNPYGRATVARPLRLGSDFFNCPAIHFVSGLTDTPDGRHFIVAYGVADCSPRMVKVRKEDVMRIMFPYKSTDDSLS